MRVQETEPHTQRRERLHRASACSAACAARKESDLFVRCLLDTGIA